MFGYVRPAADRLTQEQTDLFRSAYCGLCRTLGRRYGLPARMILNYDLAFLAILLAGGSGFSCARHRCPVHPIRGCPCGEENPALDAAADLSVILTWWQLRDGVTDHGFFGGLKYRLAALFVRRSYRKAARLRPDFDRLVQGCLGELTAQLTTIRRREYAQKLTPPFRQTNRNFCALIFQKYRLWTHRA